MFSAKYFHSKLNFLNCKSKVDGLFSKINGSQSKVYGLLVTVQPSDRTVLFTFCQSDRKLSV